MKYSTQTGSFSYDGINEFPRDLSYGKDRTSTSPVRGAKMPKIARTEAWDGNDKELPEEEDIDLSDASPVPGGIYLVADVAEVAGRHLGRYGTQL